jgi:hypothetical protein
MEGDLRTALIMVGGFVLWGMCLGIARVAASPSSSATWAATSMFVLLWFGAAALNMWMGVAKAGYSFREELPIFLLIFLVPSLVAVVVKWKFL